MKKKSVLLFFTPLHRYILAYEWSFFGSFFFFLRKLGVLKPFCFFSFLDDFSDAERSSLLLLEEISARLPFPSWPLTVSPEMMKEREREVDRKKGESRVNLVTGRTACKQAISLVNSYEYHRARGRRAKCTFA